MDDDDFEVEDEQPEAVNWADVSFALLSVPLALLEGVVDALSIIRAAFASQSRRIDDSKKFQREVMLTIESIPEAKDG